MKVLIVEDDARVADFLQRGLRAEGYTPSVAGSAEEALPLLRHGDFNLALLDVTVDAHNRGAQRFYARHGFQPHHTFTLYGRAMHALRLRL